MATGVFGPPITLDTVKATGLYPEPITQTNIADYTLKMDTAGGKEVNVAKYVDNLKDKYGWGISAKGYIYNATGTDLEFVMSKDFHGHIETNPYPGIIKNGEWGGFLHVHPLMGVGIGSSAAVVYRSLRPDTKDQYCDWCLSWDIPYSLASTNLVLTQIQEKDHFSGDSYDWDAFFALLDASNTKDTKFGYLSDVMIGQGTDVEVRGTFQMSPP